MVETINRLIRISRRLLQDLGREPTSEEIAEQMEISAEKVREIIKVSQEPVSLETPIGEEDDSHLGDFIEDHTALAPADAASHQLLKEQVEDVLDSLPSASAKCSSCVSVSMTVAAVPWKKSAKSFTSPVSVFARLKPRPCANCAIPAAAAS